MFIEIIEDPFIDQTITTTTSRPIRPVTRATQTPTTKHSRAQSTKPTKASINEQLSQNIKEVFQNPYRPSISTPAADNSESSESFIRNQLKLIMLHVQSTDHRTNVILEKVGALEEIANGLLAERPNTSKQLILKGVPPPTARTLLTKVREFVEKTLDLPQLRDSILSASITEDGILLNVRSVFDKFRILFRARTTIDSSPIEVLDPDTQSSNNLSRRQASEYDQEMEFGTKHPAAGPKSFDVRLGPSIWSNAQRGVNNLNA